MGMFRRLYIPVLHSSIAMTLDLFGAHRAAHILSAELQRSLQWHQSILEILDDGLWIVDMRAVCFGSMRAIVA